MQLRLTIPTEPDWVELLKGVRLYCRPVLRVEQAAARAYAKRKQGELGDSSDTLLAIGAETTGLPDETDPDRIEAVGDLLYAQGLGRQIIIEWEGIVDDDGNPVACTPEAIDQFMRLPFVGDLFLNKVQEQINLLFLEGEDSPAAANGTSAAGTDTAESARSEIPPAAEESEETTTSVVPT